MICKPINQRLKIFLHNRGRRRLINIFFKKRTGGRRTFNTPPSKNRNLVLDSSLSPQGPSRTTFLGSWDPLVLLFFRPRSPLGALSGQISIDFETKAYHKSNSRPIWGQFGTPSGPKNHALAYTRAWFFTFRPLQLLNPLGPLLEPSWGPLGGLFWLKSRLKIGQEAPGPVHDIFFRFWDPLGLLFLA